MAVTQFVIIRLDLLMEYVNLQTAARILVEDPSNPTARTWLRKSLAALANPALYNDEATA